MELTGNSEGEATQGVVHLGATKYRHGLTLPFSPASWYEPETATFTLDMQYARFRALVGFDPNRPNGQDESMLVKIISGERIEEETIIGTSSAPCGIDVELQPSTQLVIEVAPAHEGSRSDVTFANARVIDERDFPNMPPAPNCP